MPNSEALNSTWASTVPLVSVTTPPMTAAASRSAGTTQSMRPGAMSNSPLAAASMTPVNDVCSRATGVGVEHELAVDLTGHQRAQLSEALEDGHRAEAEFTELGAERRFGVDVGTNVAVGCDLEPNLEAGRRAGDVRVGLSRSRSFAIGFGVALARGRSRRR